MAVAARRHRLAWPAPRRPRLAGAARGLVIALVAAIWLVGLRPASLGGPASYVVVEGSSMEPTLRSGDLVLAHARETYAVGEVVAYRADGGIVIHRIVGGNPDDGYVLRGDNRTTIDQWRPRPIEILGSGVIAIPRGGDAFRALRQPAVAGGLAAGLTAWLILGPRRRPAEGRAGG